jgi:ABC-type sugar transport system substrate-binding protein
MAQGVFDAMTNAGLDPADYWIGSSNGREESWQWAKDGIITMDVNQPSTLEGGVLYQQLKAYFAGEDYRKYIHRYLEAYNLDDINEKEPSLVPNTNTDNFLSNFAAGSFITDINDPKFVTQPGF